MITIGALTSPLPFLVLGVIVGALLAFSLCLTIASRTAAARHNVRENLRHAYERAETIALRRVITACDRGEEHHRIRRIASGALYPHVLELDDTPIIPEAQGNG